MKLPFSYFVILAVVLICSCAPKVLPPPQWTYETDAVKVRIKADTMLNRDEGKAHTLHACLYQLKDPNAFNQLAGDREGLYSLLRCDLFDPGVASSKTVTVNPGEDTTLLFDRAESARYFAVVAGYYGIKKDRIVRLIQFPVITERKGFFSRTKTRRPGLLDVTLTLGSQQIENLKENVDE
ncbi:MAG: type VI secretion system lipoprotein TssJ [Desulfobacteraceae bacterium]|nr:type VI secretion system lipoprotein TssJ [Desulfobacteraceae bacterium]